MKRIMLGKNAPEKYNQELENRLAEKNNGKLIKYDELIEIAPEFALWLKEIVVYENIDSQVLIFHDTNDGDLRNVESDLPSTTVQMRKLANTNSTKH